MNPINFFNSCKAEVLKVRKTALIWVSVIGAILMAAMIFGVFQMRYLDFVNAIGRNPWEDYLNYSLPVIEVFLIPYIVLVCSSLAYYEHHNQSWKLLHTLPFSKRNFYFSKLLMALSLILLTYLLFALLTFISGNILDIFYPQFEFAHYPPNWHRIMQVILRSFLSAMGIIGLHHWISIRWKNYLVPVGIGLAGYIVAIVISGQFNLARFFPYSGPVYLGRILGGRNPTAMGVEYYGGLTDIEWMSVSLFLLFSLAGSLEMQWKQIKA